MWKVLIEAVKIEFNLCIIKCFILLTDNSVWLSFALAKTKTAPKVLFGIEQFVDRYLKSSWQLVLGSSFMWFLTSFFVASIMVFTPCMISLPFF